MPGIFASIKKLFTRKDKDGIPSPPTPEDLYDEVALRQEDIIDRYIVAQSSDTTPEQVVGALTLVSYTTTEDGQVLASAQLYGSPSTVDYSKIVNRTPNKVLLRHVADRQTSAKVGFLNFFTGSMSAQSLAEIEVTLVTSSSIPMNAIDFDALSKFSKTLTPKSHQRFVVAREVALVNTYVKLFDKVEAGAEASYGFTLGGSSYALSEYISNKSFLAIAPAFIPGTLEAEPKPELISLDPETISDALINLPLNDISNSIFLKPL